MPSELLTERDGDVLVLTISDAKTRNALSAQVLSAGIESLEGAESNPQVRAVVLRGNGEHFCSGGDVHGLGARRDAGPAAQREMLEQLHQFIEALQAFPKPVIAAVEGAAAGAGFGLVLACDLIVAAEDARFTMSYAHLGLSPDAGSSWNLLQSLPRMQVQRMIWLAESMTSSQLQAMGVVGWVSAPGEALTQALQIAERLAEMAPNALASGKELVQQAATRTLHEQLGAERDHFIDNLFSANGAEGLRAFFEKREPRFE